MLVTSNSNEFIIPRGAVIHYKESTNWLYKDGKFSLLGYILYVHFNVPTEKLDSEVYLNNLSNRTGEAYKGFTKYNEKELKHELEPWLYIYRNHTSVDSQMMCMSQYSQYKCYYLKIETNIEL